MPGRNAILAAIRQALDLPDDYSLPDKLEIACVPGWDSVGWINVLTAMEALSGAPLEPERLDNLFTIGQLSDEVVRHSQNL